jgi:hypothetical protein
MVNGVRVSYGFSVRLSEEFRWLKDLGITQVTMVDLSMFCFHSFSNSNFAQFLKFVLSEPHQCLSKHFILKTSHLKN